jgi:hypothetical protein
MGAVMDRRPANEVIHGAGSTSEKVRRLAKHGYTRTEIAAYLAIRYQHVRKVLLDAGITGGLMREGKKATVKAVSPKKIAVTKGTALLKAGFKHIAEWEITPEGGIDLNAKSLKGVGVYAMLQDDVVVYIGVSKSLHQRMYGYKLGHEGQKTSNRIRRMIMDALGKGHRISVLMALPGEAEWNGLPVILASGLEAGLIEMIQPAWNKQGVVDQI